MKVSIHYEVRNKEEFEKECELCCREITKLCSSWMVCPRYVFDFCRRIFGPNYTITDFFSCTSSRVNVTFLIVKDDIASK